MNVKKEILTNTVYYSGSYFKDLNGGKYGSYQTASKTIKVKGRYNEIYNYVEENIHLWIGRILACETAGLTPDMVERMRATCDDAQKKAVNKEIGKAYCHYTAGDTEGDIVDITIIKGILFFKTRTIIKLRGYAGYCKQLINIIQEKIQKQLEMSWLLK